MSLYVGNNPCWGSNMDPKNNPYLSFTGGSMATPPSALLARDNPRLAGGLGSYQSEAIQSASLIIQGAREGDLSKLDQAVQLAKRVANPHIRTILDEAVVAISFGTQVLSGSIYGDRDEAAGNIAQGIREVEPIAQGEEIAPQDLPMTPAELEALNKERRETGVLKPYQETNWWGAYASALPGAVQEETGRIGEQYGKTLDTIKLVALAAGAYIVARSLKVI